MGNSKSKTPVTPQQLLTAIENDILQATATGQYRCQIVVYMPDVPRALLKKLYNDGFSVSSGTLITGDRFVVVGWKGAMEGRAKICREQSDRYWQSRGDELKWSRLTVETGDGEEGAAPA